MNSPIEHDCAGGLVRSSVGADFDLHQIADALNDLLNGWSYIRSTHGELYGVGWDRAQGKGEAALDALRSRLSAAPVQEPVAKVYRQSDVSAGVMFMNGYQPKEGDLFYTSPQPAPAGQVWAPFLVDRADGVRGHYAIGRMHPDGYREVWNLRSHRWASASDDVLTLDEANALLAALSPDTQVKPGNTNEQGG